MAFADSSKRPTPPPLAPHLLQTFLSDTLRVVDPDDIEETVWEVTPAATPAPVALSSPLHVIPAWNPGGRPTDAGENVAHREGLEGLVVFAGGWFSVGAAHAADLSWAEETLVVRGLTDEAAAAVAAEHGQPALWRWDGHRLVVLASTGRPVGEVATRCRVLTHRRCVMPRHQPAPGQRCVRPGGPWTGRSISTAALWTRDRNGLLTVLGCDDCGGEPPAGAPGAPILVDRWSVASRYGPARILDAGS